MAGDISAMQMVIAALALLVAVMYALLGIYVPPRLARLAPNDRWVQRGRIGAIAFFIGCAFSHVAVAIHTLSEPAVVEGHATAHLVPHIAQVIGGTLFGYVVLRRLDLELQTRAQGEIARLRAELTRNDRLQSLGQLAGSIAHDFNNLLAVIQSFAQFVKCEVSEKELQEDLDQIIRAAERGADLTQQLLLFSRRQAPERTVVDVNEELRRLQPFMRQVLGRNVSLDVRLGEDVPPVELGAGQLDQVIVNLAANARDAMPDGGTLTVQTECRNRAGLPLARIAVRDTGTGMPRHVADQAFEPFFTTKEAGKGTGFGLATVHAIVRSAGGSAAIHTAAGAGTTFLIDLPATRRASVEPTTTDPPARPAKDVRVLLVEEDAHVRQGLERMLSGAVDLAVAADAQEALDVLAREPVEVLVTNLVMPGISGSELVERVRQTGRSVGIVCISGGVTPAPDGTLALTKPVSRDELLAAVAQTCPGR